VVIATAACGITALAGREYSGKACGNLAAGLMALNLTAIANTPLMLSDTWFSLFAATQFYYFIRYYRQKNQLCIAAQIHFHRRVVLGRIQQERTGSLTVLDLNLTVVDGFF
jgi:4-amino-4-deoxy-L-arabinose transferase-like glycosyltransferase